MEFTKTLKMSYSRISTPMTMTISVTGERLSRCGREEVRIHAPMESEKPRIDRKMQRNGIVNSR